MYLFYLDESGDPNSWNKHDNFVLAGVAIHEGQIRGLSEQLDEIQHRFLPSIAIPIEFHAQHIRGAKDRFRTMPAEERMAMLEAAYDVMGNSRFPNLIAFATAIHISAVIDGNQALRDCLEDICQQFNSFLVRQYKAGYKDKGLLIMDKSGREARIRELMADFERNGTQYGYLGNVIDVPYFADSSHTRMVQLADLLAFAAGRYFNAGDRTYLDKVLDRFDRYSPNGKQIGLRHIVSRNHACRCIASHVRRSIPR